MFCKKPWEMLSECVIICDFELEKMLSECFIICDFELEKMLSEYVTVFFHGDTT